MPARPAKTVAKSPKQNTPKSAKKPMTPKMEKKNTPNKAVTPKQNGESPQKKPFTPKQNGKSPQKKLFTPKQNCKSPLKKPFTPKQKGQTPEKKITPQKRKSDDNATTGETVAKKQKTDKKPVPNMESALTRIVNKEQHVRNPEQVERTIFVGNVPITATLKELERFFALFGKVETLRLCGLPEADPKLPIKVALIKEQFANRKRLYCYVVYQAAADAIKALEANGTEFKGHHLRVDKTSDFEYDQKKAIFITNLPFDAEEDGVCTLFQDCGDIQSVRLIRDKKTRIGKGFGYVNFNSADAVELALQMEDIKMGERDIRVSRCFNGGSGATSDGEYDKKKAIFITNLPFDAEEDDVWTLFQDCGDIQSVRLIRDKETQIGKGFGYVTFKSADAVELALQMEDIKMGERDIRVDRCSKGGSGATSDRKKTIFIGNLPYDAEEDDVCTLFQDCGDIQSVRLIRDKETQIGKGFGYVTFKSADAVELALQMEDIKMGERDIRVDRCSKGGSGATSDRKKAIFIGNLPYDAEENDVWTLFQDCGDIRSIKLMRDKETRIGKGAGFVDFKSADAVELALQMEDIKMGERDIRVRRSSKGGSGATSDGEYDKNKSIFITNLPFDAEEDDVWTLFQDCGDIRSIKLMRDKETRIGKGAGFVDFKSADAVELALQMEDIKMGEQDIYVRRSYKGGSGAPGVQINKRNADGKKNRQVQRTPKPEAAETKENEEGKTKLKRRKMTNLQNSKVQSLQTRKRKRN